MESTNSDSTPELVESSRSQTQEDVILHHLKKCNADSILYSQTPLACLFTSLVFFRHRSGFYNHMSFPLVLGRYFLALGGAMVLGNLMYVPYCVSRSRRSAEMTDSSQLKDSVRSPSLGLNSFLKVPSIGPEEPFRDPFIEAVKSTSGFTTYKDRREYSRQSLAQQQQQQPQQ